MRVKRPTFPMLLPLLIVLAILSLFWPVLFNPWLILYPTFSPLSDIMVIHWPKAQLIAQSWQAGQGAPYWTPLILSGMPLAPNQLAMLFYPPAWLFLLLPIAPTFNLLFIFHFLLGGLGVYLLLNKAHRLSPIAALLGSLTFTLNGKWLAHAVGGHVSLVGAIGWMPWTLFGLMMLLQQNNAILNSTQAEDENQPPSPYPPNTLSFLSNNLGWAVLTAITLAMQIVTHTLPVIYSVYLIGAIVMWHLILKIRQRQHKLQVLITEIKHLWWPLALIPILAGLLGAGQLIALLELAPFGNRSLSLAQAAEFSVSPVQLLIGLLLPSVKGGHELVIYLGLIPLLLVPFGLSRHYPWSWLYGGLLGFTILFALGPTTPIHALFYYIAPGFRWVRTPARLFFVGAIATAALVGFGLDNLSLTQWSDRVKKWATRLALSGGLLALMLGLGLGIGFNQLNRATLGLALLVPSALVVIILWMRQLLSPYLATILLSLLLILDLGSFDVSMIRFVSEAEALAPGRNAANYLSQKPGRFRIYSPSYSLPMQTAATWGLELADGVEPVHLAIYDQFMARAGGYNDASFSVTIPNFGAGPLDTALRDTRPNLKLLGLLNVQYLVSAFPMTWDGLSLEKQVDDAYIYTNHHVLPRAWIVHQTRPTKTDWLAQLETQANLANVALIEQDPQLNDTTLPGQAAQVTGYSPDLIDIEANIEAAGWLIMSEIWYPGWQATVNGLPKPVERVNGLLRGLYLNEAGQYQITMIYRPAGVIWGNWISGVTAGMLLLFGLRQSGIMPGIKGWVLSRLG